MSTDYDHSSEKLNSGSSKTGEPEFLAVGKLLRPHGVRGELRFTMWTDFPERLRPGVQVFVGQTHQDMTIKGMRGHSSDPIIAFEGINRREEAGQFRNQVVYVRVTELPPLPDGEIYLHQMIGMQIVQDADSAVLGRVVEILETGANNVLVVRRTNGPDFLIPDIETVVLVVDLQKSEIRVRLLPGLLPEA